MQAEIHTEKQITKKVQHNLDRAHKLIDTEKADLANQVRELQDLLKGLKGPGLGKDKVEREIEDAHLLEGFMPGVRDSLGEDALSRGIEAVCLQKTLEAEALQVGYMPGTVSASKSASGSCTWLYAL
jgi:hypothetical protein